MKDEKELSLLRKSKEAQNAMARKARKYQSGIYEKLGKHIATRFQLPLMKKTTRKSRGKVTHPTRIVYQRDNRGRLKHDSKGHKIPELTKYYTFKEFNQYFKIVRK